MCGILGVVVKSKGRSLGIVRKLYQIYRNQKLRGQDGTGVSICRNGKLFRVRDVEPEVLFSVMYYKFWKKLRKGDLIIIHHRIPTSGGGGDSLRSNHPFSNEDNSIHLVHNGSITNTNYLYNKLHKLGHKFESNICSEKNLYNITDSEILVHLLEGKVDMSKKIKFLSDIVCGTLAIAFVKKDEEGIWLYRDGNNIEVFKDEVGNLFFASEMPIGNGFKSIRNIDERALFNLNKNGIVRFRKIRKKKKISCGKGWYGFDEKGEWIASGGTQW